MIVVNRVMVGRNQQVGGGAKERATGDEYYRSILYICMKIA
jgi:hypothetical protein